MALPDYPITRNEQYLSAIAGQETELPDYPITREEQYLAYIAENGGGGGGVSVYSGARNGLYDNGFCYAVDFGTHILICGNLRNGSSFGSGNKLAFTFAGIGFPVIANVYCDTGNGTKPIIFSTGADAYGKGTVNLVVPSSNDVSFVSFSFIVSKT